MNFLRHFLFLLLATISVSADAFSHKEILSKCDAARGNLAGVEWTVEVSETDGADSTNRTIEVKARGFDMIAETIRPARQKGYKLLLVQNNMWFYKPGLSKPIPVSLRQKLTGQAANGDIASTNYAEDYEVVATESVTLDGQDCYLYSLKAANRSVTYEHIQYWISKEALLGLRADYYTSSGKKLLKTARMQYENTVEIAGEPHAFISEMTISDAINTDLETKLTFTLPKIGDISSRTFNINSLTR